MPCSAVTLSIATITAIVAAALMAIAFSTDNWLYIEVKRTNIQTYAGAESSSGINPQTQAILDSLNTKYYFYTRTRGLFRICYPKERPPTVEIYLSPVETHCSNVDYFIPDENNETKGLSDDAMNSMPRKLALEGRKIGKITEQAMKEALEEILRGKSIRLVSKEKNIPFTTLYRYNVKTKARGIENIKLEPNYAVNKVFDDQQEMALNDYFSSCAPMFYGLTTKDCRKVVILIS